MARDFCAYLPICILFFGISILQLLQYPPYFHVSIFYLVLGVIITHHKCKINIFLGNLKKNQIFVRK